MSANIAAYTAICNNCLKKFNIGEIFTIAVNLDTMTREAELFKNGDLNKIRCPECGKEFIYDLPMVIYSYENKFAYYIEPRLDNIISELKIRTPFAFMGQGFKYRIMNYQNQAREKYLIELSGLNDIAVEYIKLVSFPDEIALPFDTYSIEFVSIDGDVYHFRQYDCLGVAIDDFNIEFPENKIPEEILNLNPTNSKWQKIDRLTLQNFKEEL